MEISSRTLIPFCMPGSVRSSSASWDDCGRMFPDKLRVSSFPSRFPHYSWTAALSAHSDFVGSRMYACLCVTCHLLLWQSDRDLLRATAATLGRNGHRIRVSIHSWLWRSWLVSWRFEPSQPLGAKSGLNTTSNSFLSYSAHTSLNIDHKLVSWYFEPS